MVTREASIELGIGGVVGIAAAIGATRLFRAVLFGLNEADPFSMISAILALAGVCLVAAIVPVRRAMRVDPIVALRYEEGPDQILNLSTMNQKEARGGEPTVYTIRRLGHWPVCFEVPFPRSDC